MIPAIAATMSTSPLIVTTSLLPRLIGSSMSLPMIFRLPSTQSSMYMKLRYPVGLFSTVSRLDGTSAPIGGSSLTVTGEPVLLT